MSVGVAAFQGSRLREARLSRGLYKNNLGDMIGVTGMAIARYEDGRDRPLHERLVTLANQLGFPYEFFLRPSFVEESGPVFWRTRSVETKIAREMTEQRMKWLRETFAFLEAELTFPAFVLPHLDVPADLRSITPELIERSAEKLRQHWKFGVHPVPDVTLALENAGIPVVNLDILSEKQDGFCFFSTHLHRPFVGINTYNLSCSRARYDCAHELGHIVLHGNVTAHQERDPALHKLIENQAHRFAGAFLFPRKAFFEEVRSPSLDYFASLKRRWGMSISAMIFRAYNLEIIDDVDRTALYRGLTRRGWRGAGREPFDSRADMPMERPRMLRRGLEALLGEGFFTRSGFKTSLALPDREIEQLTGVDAGYFQSAELVQLAVPRHAKAMRSLDAESGEVIEFSKRYR